MKRSVISIIFLLIIGSLFFAFNPRSVKSGVTSEQRKGNNVLPENDLPNLPAAPDLVERDLPGDESDASLLPPPAAGIAFIRETISSEWLDAPEKMAGRQRVRIVKADFKYPLLRLEEAVVTDGETGEQRITLLRASVADHVMVGSPPGGDQNEAVRILSEKGYRIRTVEPGSHIIAEIPDYESAGDQEAAISDIEGLGEFIDFAEPDYLVFPSLSPNDQAFITGKMWGLHNPGTEAGSKADADIDAPEAWEIRNGAPGVTVAVTDTGIKYDHEDLRDNMWAHPATGVHGFDAYDDDYDPMDTGGHGTHCAGTIGGRGNNSNGITGVAWDVQLMALRFLGPYGGTTSDGIRVINYARLNGADIISASWGGGGFSQSLLNAIDACRLADIPFVAAAGNDGVNNDSNPHYPSSYNLPNIVSVAATTKADALSSFSCFGKYSVDIGAPGSSIYSSYIGGTASYKYLNGTSMATPHVSGALALAKAQFPGESSASLIGRLYASADPISALSGKTSSGGRLNLQRLLSGLAPPGDNDNFANAYRFTDGYGVWSGSNKTATRESDEDTFSLPGIGNRSLWFAFNSGKGGLVTLTGRAQISAYRMVAFEGSSKTSTKVVADSGEVETSRQSVIFFESKPNTEYRVVMDTRHVFDQMYTLSYQQSPPNDFFNSAELVSGDSFSVSGTNRGATEELFEKSAPHAGTGRGKSAWWRWTPARDQNFTISTYGSDFDTVLAVYTGEGSQNLTEVVSNDDRSALDYTSQVTFQAITGRTYHIAVDGYREDAASGNIQLTGFRSDIPLILRQPVDVVAELGTRAVFSVSAFNNSVLGYQWFKGDTALPGGYGPEFAINSVTLSDLGTYRVEVTNALGTAVSTDATLTQKFIPPAITWKSADTAIAAGDRLKVGILASGTDPVTFVWKKDGAPLAGEQSSTLIYEDATAEMAGLYTCTASNEAGDASASIRVRVIQSPFESFSWSREGVAGAPISDLKVIDGKCHAVSGNRILISENGDDWEEWMLPPGFEGSMIAKNGASFLCTGFQRDGKQSVAISTDGSTWADPIPMTGLPSQSVSVGLPMSQLLSHAGKLVAVSLNAVLHSTDGVNWTSATSSLSGGTPAPLYTQRRILEWEGSLYLPAGEQYSNASLRTSTDGVSWIETPLPLNPSGEVTGAGEFLAPCGGKLYMVSEWGSFSSADGSAWAFEGRKRAPGSARNFRIAEATEGCFAFNPDSQSYYFVSPPVGWGGATELIARTVQPLGSQNFTCAVGFGDGAVFGTANGLLKRVSHPRDVTLPKEIAGPLDSIRHVNREFLAYKTGATGSVLISGDGTEWRQGRSFQTPTEPLNPPAAFIAGRYLGSAISSTSPKAGWTPAAITSKSLPAGMSLAVSSAAFDGTRWLALSQGKISSINPDGAAWSTVSASGYTPGRYDRILRFKNRWYAITASGDSPVYSSADGTSWTATATVRVSRLAILGEKLCGVTADGSQSYVSQDGVTWSGFAVNHRIGSTGIGALSLEAAALEEFNGAIVLLVRGKFDKRGFLFFSDDGEQWINVAMPTQIRDFAVGNGILCVATVNGGILSAKETGGQPAAAPLVSISSPGHKSVHTQGSPVTITGTAVNPEGGSVATECFVDGVSLGVSSGQAFRFTFLPSDPTGHVVTVRTSGSGNLVGTDEILVSVSPPQLPNRLDSGEGNNHVPIISWTSFGNRSYMAGTHSLYRSRGDGTLESMLLPSLPSAITNIVSGNGTLIVQTSTGALATRDGINWSRMDGIIQGFNGSRGNIVFRDGWFSAISGTSPTTTIHSRDGFEWESGGTFPTSTSTPVPPVVISEKILLTIPPYRSVDGGVNWVEIPELSVENSHRGSIAAAFGKVFASLPDGQILVSTDEGASWVETHSFDPPPAGQNTRLGFHQGRLFWGAGGYWLGATGDGEDWEMLTGDAILSSRVDSINGRLVAPGDTGMVSSADGITWSASPESPRNPVRDLIGRDGSHLIQGDSSGGLWRTEDGIRWDRVMAGQTLAPPELYSDISKLTPVRIAGKTVYGIPYYGFHYTATNGLDWKQATFNGGPLPGSPQANQLWTDGQIAFAGVDRSNPVDGASPKELWVSTNGSDWSEITSWRHGATAGMIAFGSKWIALTANGEVLVTTDNGATWGEDTLEGLKSGKILISFAGRIIAIGTEAPNQSGVSVVYSSADGGSWIRHGTLSSEQTGSIVSAASSGEALVVMTSLGYLYTATDSSVEWTRTATTSSSSSQLKLQVVGGMFSLENKLVSLDAITWQVPTQTGSSILTPSYFFAGRYISFAYYVTPHWSLDGLNWVAMTGADSSLTYSPMVSLDGSALRARGSNGITWETLDGMSWAKAADAPPHPSSSEKPTHIIKFGSSLLVGGTSGMMLASQDDGVTWHTALLDGKPFPSGMNIRSLVANATEAIAIHTLNANVFPPTSRYFRTTDGINWTENTTLGALALVNASPSGNGWIGIRGNGSLVKSTDGANTWQSAGAVPGALYGYDISDYNGLLVAASTANSSGNALTIHTSPDGVEWTQRHATTYGVHSGSSFFKAHGLLYFGNGPASQQSPDGIAWSPFDKPQSPAAPSGHRVKTMVPIGNSFIGFNAFGNTSYFWTAPAVAGAWVTSPPYQNQITGIGTPDSSRLFLFGTGLIKEVVQNDLSISFLDPAAGIYGVGDEISLSVTVRNLGTPVTQAPDSLPFEAWLSSDGFFGDENDTYVGRVNVAATLPAPGESILLDVGFLLPDAIAPGNQRIVLKLATENLISETNRANNISISSDATVSIPEWEFSVATNGNGQVSRDFAATRYPHKSRISLTANAGKGATFAGWGGDAFSPNNQITVLMDGNKSVEANFTSRANLRLFVRGLGEVTGLADLGSYALGATATLAAAPAEGWKFSHWSGASSASSAATSVLMDGEKILTANFVQNIADWKASHFNGEDLADSSISGPEADPDGDGVKNWQEHLHASNPKNRASSGVVSLTLDGDFLRCIYTRHSSPGAGASLACEAGRNMTDWDSPELEERIISTLDGIETIEARIPKGTGSRGFIRFRYVPESP